MNKPKKPQKQTPGTVQRRDMFSTPRYATELLLPFLNHRFEIIWECAAGKGKISEVFVQLGYKTFSSDIRKEKDYINVVDFLNDPIPDALVLDWNATCIITNLPFSLKKQFFNKCIEYNLPFALLLPFDLSLWICDAFEKYDCQAVVPNRRIDFITPTGKSGKSSSSQFHSFWLTRYLNLTKQLNIVELTQEMKRNV